MQLTLRLQETTKKKVQVTFPIYRKLALGASTSYQQQINERCCHEITVSHDDVAGTTCVLDIDREPMSDSLTTHDYALGLGKYQSNKAEFQKALQQAVKFLQLLSEE